MTSVKSPAGRTWADDDDSSASDSGEYIPTSGTSAGGVRIPPTHTSRLDAKGVKTVTSYRTSSNNPNQLIKSVTRVKVTTVKVREHVDVNKRRKWKRFGQAAIDEDQSNVTIVSREDIYMEDPHADISLEEDDPTKAISANLNAFWAKQQRRQLERKYDVEETDVEAIGLSQADVNAGWRQVPSSAGPQKYVPPGRAAAANTGGKSLAALADAQGGGDGDGKRRTMDGDRDQNTIRVTNISEDTTEADLQELFQPFGRISRVYLAKDKETLQSRGFAFVSFVHRDDAQRAMDKLQGHGYAHLILRLEWAKPSAPKDPSADGTQFRSGYGKALAQDTKEKVSFASNLTR
mmetsp:Transcript_9812/g.14193  ORF Transcript_9812/g.14193 Transcript_9812/m.14193 type:complete len:348 (+) Transcript_9812:69-1112(+)